MTMVVSDLPIAPGVTGMGLAVESKAKKKHLSKLENYLYEYLKIETIISRNGAGKTI